MIETGPVRANANTAATQKLTRAEAIPQAAADTASDQQLLASAKDLERSFIAEMLGESGFVKAMTAQSGFGGDAYSRFLVEAVAERIVDRGGWGLARNIFGALQKGAVK